MKLHGISIAHVKGKSHGGSSIELIPFRECDILDAHNLNRAALTRHGEPQLWKNAGSLEPYCLYTSVSTD